MNAIAMLKKDHRDILAALRRLERSRDGSARDRQKMVNGIIRDLSVHSSAEEQVVYPLARRRLPKLDPAVLRALEEHHILKVTLSELEHMKMTDERLWAKLEVLGAEFRTHVAEEEQIILPGLERALSERELSTLGAMIERAKSVAPTRPHPMAPDTPPANVITGVGAALIDRARDGARQMMGRVKRGPNARTRGVARRNARRQTARA